MPTETQSDKIQPWKQYWPPKTSSALENLGFKKGEVMVFDGNPKGGPSPGKDPVQSEADRSKVEREE
jgi:hypothetical protein